MEAQQIPAERKGVFRSGFKWNSIMAFSTAFFKLIRGFIVPKLLVFPDVYGLFTSIGVYQRYLNYADFGATAYLSKQYPRLFHNNELYKSEELLNAVLNFFIIALGLSGVILFFMSRYYHGQNEDFYKTALLLLIPITIIVNIRTLLANLAAVLYNYKASSKITIINNIASFICVVTGIDMKGAIGGVYGILCAELVNLVAAFFITRPGHKFHFSFSWIRYLRHFLRQLSVGLVELVAGTFDVFVLLLFFSKELFGYYSLALAFSWGMIAISSVLATTLAPKLMALSYREEYRISELSFKAVIMYLLICFTTFIPLCFVLIFLINKYFVHYGYSLHFIFIVLFSGVLRGMNAIQKGNVLAYDREHKYITVAIVIFGIYGLFSYAFHSFNLDFMSYIYLISVTDIIFCSWLVFFSGPRYSGRQVRILLATLGLFIAIVYIAQWLMPHVKVGVRYYLLFLMILTIIGSGLFLLKGRILQLSRFIINY